MFTHIFSVVVGLCLGLIISLTHSDQTACPAFTLSEYAYIKKQSYCFNHVIETNYHKWQ